MPVFFYPEMSLGIKNNFKLYDCFCVHLVYCEYIIYEQVMNIETPVIVTKDDQQNDSTCDFFKFS